MENRVRSLIQEAGGVDEVVIEDLVKQLSGTDK